MLPVAGIGLGTLGWLELRLLSELPEVRVVGAADPDPGARERFADEFDARAYETHEDLLASADPAAVTVASPHAFHYEQARDCIERGVDVHVEKPIATTLADATDLVERAAATGVVLAVGYQRRFDPRFRELRRLLDAGRIGDPHTVVCHLEQQWIGWNADRWRGDPELSGGGQLFDSGSHLLDALLWTTRSDPVAVAAVIDRRGSDVDVNSALSVQLARGEDRLTASVGVSGEGASSPSPGESFLVLGTDGSLSYDGERLAVTEGGTRYVATPERLDFEEITRAKLENFLAAVRGESAPAATGADARKVVALTTAAVEAAERGETIDVDR
ncbi:MAG: Gfo/Idh/MocA family protein [Salinigranum sp.]